LQSTNLELRNNNTIIVVIHIFYFLRHVGRYHVTLLLNHEVKRNYVWRFPYSVFPDIVKDCPKMRNLPKIFLRNFKNVGPVH